MTVAAWHTTVTVTGPGPGQPQSVRLGSFTVTVTVTAEPDLDSVSLVSESLSHGVKVLRGPMRPARLGPTPGHGRPGPVAALRLAGRAGVAAAK